MGAVTEPRLPRIMFVDCSVGFGGAARSLALLLQRFREPPPVLVSSQTPDILLSLFPGVVTYRFRGVFSYRNFDAVKARLESLPGPLRWLLLKGLAVLDLLVSMVNVARFIRLMRRHRIELVHLNNGILPPEAIVAARLLKIPSVAHLRGIPGLELGLGNRLARQVDAIIAISQAVGSAVPAGSPPVYVIHNYVDVTPFDEAGPAAQRLREEWGAGPDDVVVGIFGRVVEWKGQLEFTEAVLAAMAENPRIRAAIIGDESDGHREYYRRIGEMVAASPFPSRFVLAGYRRDVEACYAATDIVVHASIEPEPFGRVLIEAMAARKPVIASAEGGPLEIVTPGVDGLLVPPGDVGALQRAVLDLAGDARRRAALGEAGYAHAGARFGPEAAAAQVEKVYREVLDRHAASLRRH